MPPAIIRVSNLCKRFKDITAVNDLSFTVAAGSVYGFLGQNGAGKSTTIRMLLSLIRPDAGEIEIFGMDLSRHRKEILRQTGAIIEKPDLYKYLTALENLRLFAALSGKKIPERQLLEQLDQVGLAARAHHRVKTYSQGMKQRLGIAVALVHDPQLIILDEPTNGLDPQGIADVRNLILHLSRDLGKTIFISSHLLHEMEMIAGHMLIIDRGRKVAEGKKEELLHPASTQVELVTADKAAALSVIRATKWGAFLEEGKDECILFSLGRDAIPDLNRALVENGIRVLSIRPRHSLEDLFLSLTAHA